MQFVPQMGKRFCFKIITGWMFSFVVFIELCAWVSEWNYVSHYLQTASVFHAKNVKKQSRKV
jgi:hypothetical protein